MLLAILLSVFLLGMYRARLNVKGYHDDYMAKDRTDAVKGFFILLVLLPHSLKHISRSGYLFDGFGDSLYYSFFMGLAQLPVVVFLFYSGYGVYESYKRREQMYVERMPRHRILCTLLNFDVSVVAFIVVSLLFGITITVKQGLLAFTSWESVGNDNWYIFVILMCYLMFLV